MPSKWAKTSEHCTNVNEFSTKENYESIFRAPDSCNSVCWLARKAKILIDSFAMARADFCMCSKLNEFMPPPPPPLPPPLSCHWWNLQTGDILATAPFFCLSFSSSLAPIHVHFACGCQAAAKFVVARVRQVKERFVQCIHMCSSSSSNNNNRTIYYTNRTRHTHTQHLRQTWKRSDFSSFVCFSICVWRAIFFSSFFFFIRLLCSSIRRFLYSTLYTPPYTTYMCVWVSEWVCKRQYYYHISNLDVSELVHSAHPQFIFVPNAKNMNEIWRSAQIRY